jgi:hypothetical protein
MRVAHDQMRETDSALRRSKMVSSFLLKRPLHLALTYETASGRLCGFVASNRDAAVVSAKS